MTWLLEDPTTVILAGVLVEALLAIVLVRTGRAVVLLAAAGVLALVLLLVALEWVVVTDTEEIETSLDRIAAALEANDVAAVLAAIHPSAGRMRGEVQSRLAGATIESATISGLSVLLHNTQPPTATARFRGVVTGKDNTGQVPYETLIRRFSVELVRENGRWQLTDYAMHDLHDENP